MHTKHADCFGPWSDPEKFQVRAERHDAHRVHEVPEPAPFRGSLQEIALRPAGRGRVRSLRGFGQEKGACLRVAAGLLRKVRAGEMAERLKAHAWKACVRASVPWVRIPLSPPYTLVCSRFFMKCSPVP